MQGMSDDRGSAGEDKGVLWNEDIVPGLTCIGTAGNLPKAGTTNKYHGCVARMDENVQKLRCSSWEVKDEGIPGCATSKGAIESMSKPANVERLRVFRVYRYGKGCFIQQACPLPFLRPDGAEGDG